MNPSLLRFALASACGLFAASSPAQTISINQNGSLVEMCANARETVAHDTAQAYFAYSVTSRNKIDAANAVNQLMGQAIRHVKAQHPNLTLGGQAYNTHQVHDEKGQPRDEWTVRQSFSVTGKELNEFADMVAQLQGMGVNLESMSTHLSNDGRRRAEAHLHEQAFADVKSRIASVAKAFGQSPSAWRVAHMNTMPNNPCNGYSRPVYAAAPMTMRAEKAQDSVVSPEITAGEDEMAVTFYIAVRAR